MSYARFGKESDVYVFLSNSGHLECCACNLDGAPEIFTTKTTAGMLAHLDQHRAASDDVPQGTYLGLRDDSIRNDAWMSGQMTDAEFEASFGD